MRITILKYILSKLLLDNGASASIIRRNVMDERHKILREKKN